jgi:hypothetical protein
MEAVPGLRRAVVSEYRRVVRPPWEIPTALVTNGALMVAAWFLLPPRAHAFMFSLNGPLAFPVILASWMLADTPSTNVMGTSTALALSVLRDQAAYWRWLAARCIVIGSLVGVAIGLWVARRLLAWRTTRLAAYLANTERGCLNSRCGPSCPAG